MAENIRIEEQKEKAQRTLGIMLDYLGLEATLKVEEKGSRIAIKIASDDAGRIIGRKGQSLESLQLLLNRMMFNGDEECPRILLDIDGYGRGKNSKDDAVTEGGESRDSGDNRRGRRRRRSPEEEEEIDAQLVQQALDAAKEVKRWGDPVVLPKMNSHDRRIIHITLQEDGEVETQSEGDGAFKKVVISPKKAEN
ncbi:MAG: KH domain-containing protein [Lentisphaeria bacterium]|nr:KH domain-containing protein [Lentisphaeria bacterium]